MQSLYDIPAPAKLNLFLHIVGRRHDGYHLLQSAFMLIDWCDTLHFALRSDGRISREDLNPTALPAHDLCTRAAQALQAATQCPLGVHIGLSKSIPTQAGMGGGSSDAASTLLALNQLWGLQLSKTELQRIALTLGADVPFFIAGQHAWVEGIGEKITPIQLPPSQWLVVKPAQGLDTGLIFSSPTLKRDSEPATIAGFAANAFGFGRNDLQPVAQALCPEISEALNWLREQGLEGRMTGSGSTVFAQVMQPLNLNHTPPACQVKCCSSLDVHPLSDWAASDGLLVNSP